MKLSILVAGVLALTFPTGAGAQEWTYDSNTREGAFWRSGSFQLSEKSPGKYIGRYHLPSASQCLQSDLATTTVVTEGGTQVTKLTPLMRNCPEIRPKAEGPKPSAPVTQARN